MATIFFISDTHFGHANIVHLFKRADGSPARDFASVEEMDETMITRWNDRVRTTDHVYHLGDLTMARGGATKYIDSIMSRLNGHKRIILGNHDQLRSKWYQEHFEKVYACRVLDGIIFTHIPIAPWSIGRFKANVHGHVHCNAPLVYTIHALGGRSDQDPEPWTGRYMNISVEATNYTPLSLEEIQGFL